MRSHTNDPSILFFCKFPPPYTGQTIGTHIFADMLDDVLGVRRINTSLGFIRPENVSWRWIQYYGAFVMHFLRQLQRLRETLKYRDVDTLYFVASPSLLGLLKNVVTVRAARSHVARIVAHVHNGNYQNIYEKDGIASWAAAYVAKHVDTFIFTSDMLSRRLEPYLPEEKRAVVHNTVDEEVRCIREEIRAKVQRRRSRNTFRILYLSNMIPSKGYLDLARSVAQLRQKVTTPLQVDFVGDWPDAQNQNVFLSKIRKWNLQDVVTVHGRLTDRQRIKQFLLEADAFVLPTYYPNEAQPITIIEAMNAGTPIISTRHASIPEYVFDGENGYLVDKQAPAQLVDALLALMDPGRWTEMARRARTTYEEMFSPRAVQQQMADVLHRELLNP